MNSVKAAILERLAVIAAIFVAGYFVARAAHSAPVNADRTAHAIVISAR